MRGTCCCNLESLHPFLTAIHVLGTNYLELVVYILRRERGKPFFTAAAEMTNVRIRNENTLEFLKNFVPKKKLWGADFEGLN